MADNKAEKALKKVIINLAPEEKFGEPVMVDELIQVDITDKLDQSKNYYLNSIRVDYGDYGRDVNYVSFREFQGFKEKVENILDATIVNAKQRESIQKLLNQAYYSGAKYDVML
jgi:hypothetical protein